MVYNREQAARRAEASTRNTPGTCQLWTRDIFDSPSAGDVDHDGDADAVDGWKSEGRAHQHPGDRHPPRGVPIAFHGGSKGEGHRAVTLGGIHVRSTDMDENAYHPGHVATTTIAAIEEHMGVAYTGWSDTIDGYPIPLPPPPKPTRITEFRKGGPKWDVKLLDEAVKNGRTGTVARVRNGIEMEVKGLPHDKDSSRIRVFIDTFNKTRVLRMGLLNDAIAAGRTGKVQFIRNEIRRLIAELPES